MDLENGIKRKLELIHTVWNILILIVRLKMKRITGDKRIGGWPMGNSVEEDYDSKFSMTCEICGGTGRRQAFRRQARIYQDTVLVPACQDECDKFKYGIQFWRAFEKDHSIPCVVCSEDLF